MLFVIDNIDELVQTLLYFLTAMCGLKIWLVTVYHKPKISYLFRMMKRLDSFIGDDIRHQETIRKGTRRAIYFHLFEFTTYFITATLLWIDALIKIDRVLIWLYWVPFEYQNNEIVYQSVLFYQYLATAFTAAMHSTIDSIGLGMESHLDVLGQRMGKNRLENQKINTWRYLEWQKSCEKELKECVHIHQFCVE